MNMGLQVVGAGLGRTGTLSLKQALEQLLDGPCYHMMEVFGKRDVIDTWHRAAEGDSPDWDAFLDGYVATVDWPAAAFWDQLAEANPDAIVLLSTRDADGWWRSASNTIFAVRLGDGETGSDLEAHHAMAETLFRNTFTASWQEEEAAKAAFLAHNDRVRASVPADRLVEYQPGDGWGPLCDALGVPEPSEPYPHVNTTDDFRQMAGLDQPG
jgi:hypothetical protein